MGLKVLGVCHSTCMTCRTQSDLAATHASSSLPNGMCSTLAATSGLSTLNLSRAMSPQVAEYGYIPSALPDAHCFGEASSAQVPPPGPNCYVKQLALQVIRTK